MTNAYQTLLDQHLKEEADKKARKAERKAKKEAEKAEKKKGPGRIRRALDFAHRVATVAYLGNETIEEMKKAREAKVKSDYQADFIKHRRDVCYEFLSRKDPNFSKMYTKEEFEGLPQFAGIQERIFTYAEKEKTKLDELELQKNAAKELIDQLEAKLNQYNTTLATTTGIVLNARDRSALARDALQTEAQYRAELCKFQQLDARYTTANTAYQTNVQNNNQTLTTIVRGMPPVIPISARPQPGDIRGLVKALAYYEVWKNTAPGSAVEQKAA